MTFFCNASFLTDPLYRSSRLTFSWWITSFPLFEPRERPPPPKNMSKMSIGLCISLAIPPSLIACSPPRSYRSRFFGSAKTSYACEIALNCTTNEHSHLRVLLYKSSRPIFSQRTTSINTAWYLVDNDIWRHHMVIYVSANWLLINIVNCWCRTVNYWNKNR